MNQVIRDRGLFFEVISALAVGHVNVLRVIRAVNELGKTRNLTRYLWDSLQAIEGYGLYPISRNSGWTTLEDELLGSLQWCLKSYGCRRYLQIRLNGRDLLFATAADYDVSTMITDWYGDKTEQLTEAEAAALLGHL